MESENNDLKRIFSGKDLAKLIFPLVIELMLTLLVGMIDSVMVSSAGEAAVSGVSLVDTVFQLLIYIFSAFGTGGAVVAGQYLGAGQKNNAKETPYRVSFLLTKAGRKLRLSIYYRMACRGPVSKEEKYRGSKEKVLYHNTDLLSQREAAYRSCVLHRGDGRYRAV